MTVNITESAKIKIDSICQNTGKHVRLSILSGGCNGFVKSFDLDNEITDADTKIECNTGLLLIDDVSFEFLKGSTVDYVASLVGASFIVNIPTELSSCGCGNSFSI